MSGPRHIRVAGRILAAIVVLVSLTFGVWLFTGVPRPVEDALREAEFEPCEKRYGTARNAQDSTAIDALVVKPRSRFSRAVTCGGLRVAIERAETGSAPAPDRSRPR